MKKLFKLLSSVALAGLLATAAHAADAQATEAKVIKVTGSATVTLPGQSGAIALTEGMSLPAGSTITTGAGSEVDIQPMAGALTAIRANSSVSLDELSVNKNDAGVVTKQTAQIGLKSGNVVSSLDAGRKSINNYGVRTPKGVAAARGTVYSVGVEVTGGTTVATMTGSVTITTASGVSYQVDIGTGIILGITSNGLTATSETPVTLAELVAQEAANGTSGGENSITTAIAAAVTTVATAVQTNTIGTSSDAAVTALAAVVKVAAQANPTEAATFTTQAVTAVTASTSAVSGIGATAAAAAVTEAAVQGAVQGVVAAGGSAAQAQAATTSVTTAATTAATASAAAGGATVNTTTVLEAAATGAQTATAGTTVAAPTVTAPTTETPTTPVVVPPTVSTPITPIDPTVVSPSGGQ